MLFARCMAFAMMATASIALAAQTGAPRRNPADAVPADALPAYESAFKDYRPAPPAQDEADDAWRRANDEMGRLKGHAGHAQAAAGATDEATTQHDPDAPAATHSGHAGKHAMPVPDGGKK